MTFFDLTNVSFTYSNKSGSVLDGFTLRMARGEVVGILGQSGCGKSTLLRIIAGLELPASGRLVIDGTTMVDERSFVQPERRGVGMVFQDYALFPHLTVAQNILFGLHRLSRKERAARLAEMLELIKLEDCRGRYPHELSGGQQQRVAFARALAPNPSVLLMDEPFSNLDAHLKADIREQLREMLRLSGITAILVTHDRADADAICDRVVTISRQQAAGQR